MWFGLCLDVCRVLKIGAHLLSKLCGVTAPVALKIATNTQQDNFKAFCPTAIECNLTEEVYLLGYDAVQSAKISWTT
jgi:hypothetical protein